MLPHPQGVEPWGNYFMARSRLNIRGTSLGVLSILSDELLLELLSHLGPADLTRASTASKALYCFCRHDEVWKALLLQEFGGAFQWPGSSWREAYIATAAAAAAAITSQSQAFQVPGASPALSAESASLSLHPPLSGDVLNSRKRTADPVTADPPTSKRLRTQTKPLAPASRAAGEEAFDLVIDATSNSSLTAATSVIAAAAGGRRGGKKGSAAASKAGLHGGTAALMVQPLSKRLQVQGMYSDLLYQPWHFAQLEVDPEWLVIDNIERRGGLSAAQFRTEYELPNKPVVLTDALDGWPALQRWDRDFLRTAFKGQDIVAGSYDMSMPTYLQYCDSCTDEMPLYLFDKEFAKKAPSLASDFSVPEHFAEDLFSVLGPEGRPDYRWLIMGPARSGSTFHIDPNATSAWNGCVSGSKKWILYPPHVTPPGVHPSADGADVATPISLMEWYAGFYEGTKEGKVRPTECIVKAGELIFVPRGWWHCALNLEESVAVTQNYVSSVNLPQVLRFLEPGRPELVSGCREEDRSTLHDRFVAALQLRAPKVWEGLMASRAEQHRIAEGDKKLSALFRALPTHTPRQTQQQQLEQQAAQSTDIGHNAFPTSSQPQHQNQQARSSTLPEQVSCSREGVHNTATIANTSVVGCADMQLDKACSIDAGNSVVGSKDVSMEAPADPDAGSFSFSFGFKF